MCLELGVELTHPMGAAVSSALFSSFVQLAQMLFLAFVPMLLVRPSPFTPRVAFGTART